MTSLARQESTAMKLNRPFHPRDRLGAALGLSLLLTGCSERSQDLAKTPPNNAPEDGPVRYVRVVEQKVPETLDLAAKVQPDPTRVVRIFPPASGRLAA